MIQSIKELIHCLKSITIQYLALLYKIAYTCKFLNQARAWFPEITFVRDVGMFMHVCVCVCVSVYPPPRQ